MRESRSHGKEVKIITMNRYMCLLCGFVFDEAIGDLEHGIQPGTRWEDIPLTWRCPDCGAMKEDFEMIQI